MSRFFADDAIQRYPARRHELDGRERLHAELAAHIRFGVSIDQHAHELLRQRDDLQIGKGFVGHLVTKVTPLGSEEDQHRFVVCLRACSIAPRIALDEIQMTPGDRWERPGLNCRPRRRTAGHGYACAG